jgi:5'(3')-deoxyribonucleotidase
MKKVNVYLDMDGTIANLYEQENWLERLLNEENGLFATCEPMTTEEVIFKVFPKNQFNVKILSMTPKNVSKAYCETVIKEKNAWLDKFFPNITKRHYLPYGNNKNFKNSKNAVLVDDNATIRENFKGLALNPSELWG